MHSSEVALRRLKALVESRQGHSEHVAAAASVVRQPSSGVPEEGGEEPGL